MYYDYRSYLNTIISELQSQTTRIDNLYAMVFCLFGFVMFLMIMQRRSYK